MSNFTLKSIQDNVRDLLLSDPFFATIPVLSEDPATIAYKIQSAIDKIGVVALVMVPSAQVNHPDQPGPFFDTIPITVEIAENPVVNRPTGSTNPGAPDIAMAIATILHRKQISAGTNQTITIKRIQNIAPPQNVNLVITHVDAVVNGVGVGYAQPLAPVVIASPTTPGNQTVTLSLAFALPGAAIFYTLDKTFPMPRNGTLYSGPISVSAGQMLRARAYLAGYQLVQETTIQY